MNLKEKERKFKMKNKKISNKMKIVLTGIALLVSIVGTTYAWWNSQVQSSHEVTLGNMKLEGDFPSIASEMYEPGTSMEAEGTLKNKGTIPMLVKLENKSQIKFMYSNDDLLIIPEEKRVYENDKYKAIKLELTPKSGKYNDNTKQDIFWFIDSNKNKYILMEPGSEIDIITVANFDGDVMTSRYQNSIIKINTNYRGTQVIEGAINNEFGISSSDLSTINDDSRGYKSSDIGMDRLIELLNRK